MTASSWAEGLASRPSSISRRVGSDPFRSIAPLTKNIVGTDVQRLVRLRTPGHRAIASVHAGAVSLPASRWNRTQETVSFRAGAEMAQLTAAPLRVCYA